MAIVPGGPAPTVSTTTTGSTRRHPRRSSKGRWLLHGALTMNLVFLVTVAACAATTPPTDDQNRGDAEAATTDTTNPAGITLEWAERRRLAEVVAKMPSGWPETKAMRHAANEPLGDAIDRARWRRISALMPSGWPATEAMRQAAAWPDAQSRK